MRCRKCGGFSVSTPLTPGGNTVECAGTNSTGIEAIQTLLKIYATARIAGFDTTYDYISGQQNKSLDLFVDGRSGIPYRFSMEGSLHKYYLHKVSY